MNGVKPDERIRTPMHWENSPTAGFTTGARAWENLQSADNIAAANVADQTADPASLLSHYRRLIHLRNANSALRRGALTAVDSSARGVYAFLRHDAQQTLLVLINLTGEPAVGFSLTLDDSELDLSTPALIFGGGDVAAPALSEAGGFDAYAPLPVLAPRGLVVIEF